MLEVTLSQHYQISTPAFFNEWLDGFTPLGEEDHHLLSQNASPKLRTFSARL
jgi:hypothetical protein